MRKLVYKDGTPMREYTSEIIEELMSKQQTAVEWLIEQMICQMGIRIENTTIGCELFDQAKEMEKEQHSDTWTDAQIFKEDDNFIGKSKTFDQYFNETYGEK